MAIWAANRLSCPIRKVVVAPDGLSVRIATLCLREGYIHEIKAGGVRSAKDRETVEARIRALRGT